MKVSDSLPLPSERPSFPGCSFILREVFLLSTHVPQSGQGLPRSYATFVQHAPFSDPGRKTEDSPFTSSVLLPSSKRKLSASPMIHISRLNSAAYCLTVYA